MSDVLEVTPRQALGKLNTRRLRAGGQLPAVLYGHGGEPVNLSVPEDQLQAGLRHGAKVVQLQGAAQGQALLQEVQWDTFHQRVLHVDLLRVKASDRVHVEVPVALRGQAPGEREGGVVEQLVRSVEIEVAPGSIPETLHLNINALHLNGTLQGADIEDLPAGAKILGEDKTIAHCVEPTVKAEEAEAASAAGSEPEVIGRKAEEAGED